MASRVHHMGESAPYTTSATITSAQVSQTGYADLASHTPTTTWSSCMVPARNTVSMVASVPSSLQMAAARSEADLRAAPPASSMLSPNSECPPDGTSTRPLSEMWMGSTSSLPPAPVGAAGTQAQPSPGYPRVESNSRVERVLSGAEASGALCAGSAQSHLTATSQPTWPHHTAPHLGGS